MARVNSSGVFPTVSMPWTKKRARISDESSAFTVSR